MTRDFKRLTQDMDRLKKYVQKDLPRRIGVTAVKHFKDNFQKEGFDNKKWKPAKRIGMALGAEGKRKTLTGHSGQLGRSLKYKLTPGKVVITSDIPYAKIHNEGGRVAGTQNIRAHKRKTKRGTQNVRAHSRKVNFVIPKRQFIGASNILNKKIKRKVNNDIKTILL